MNNVNILVIANYINKNLNYYKKLYIIYDKLPLLLKNFYKDYGYNKKTIKKIREFLFFYKILKKYPYFSINFLKFIWTNHLKFINNYVLLYDTINNYLNKYNDNIYYINKINSQFFLKNLKKKEFIDKFVIFENNIENNINDFEIIDKKETFLLFINKNVLNKLIDPNLFYNNLSIYIDENLHDPIKLNSKLKMFFFYLFFSNSEKDIIKIIDEFSIQFTNEYIYANINIKNFVEFSIVLNKKEIAKLNFNVLKLNRTYILKNSKLNFLLECINSYNYLNLLNKENFLKIYNILF